MSYPKKCKKMSILSHKSIPFPMKPIDFQTLNASNASGSNATGLVSVWLALHGSIAQRRDLVSVRG